MSKFLLEGRLSAKSGHYYTVGLVVNADSFSDAEDKGLIFSKTAVLLGMRGFLIEHIFDSSHGPSKQTVLIYMNDASNLTYTDAEDGFDKFLKESLLNYWLAAKDKK